MTEHEELLDIKQAAHLLNVSETSLRRWTNAGWLPCMRVGGRRERRFRRTDLLAFVDEQSGRISAVRSPLTEPRHAVIDGIDVAHGTHLCSLVASDAGLATQAAAFLAGGVRPGSVCFLAASPRTGRAVIAHLEERHPSLQTHIRAGRLVIAAHASSTQAQLEYWVKQMRAATRHGARSLRVVGDVRGLAEHVSADELVDYEAGYEKLVARRFPVVTLCQYDVRHFSALELLHSFEGHPDTFAYPAERLLA